MCSSNVQAVRGLPNNRSYGRWKESRWEKAKVRVAKVVKWLWPSNSRGTTDIQLGGAFASSRYAGEFAGPTQSHFGGYAHHGAGHGGGSYLTAPYAGDGRSYASGGWY